MRRLIWIDALRVFGICLIVFGHCLQGGILRVILYSFHVPLFFMISGYLAEMLHSGKSQIRIKRLLLPYLYWTVLSLVPYIIFGNDVTISKCICSIFPINGFICWNSPLWFLYTLFVVELIAPSFPKNVKGFYSLLVAGGLLGVCWAIGEFVDGDNFLAYKQISLSCFFYLLGGILFRYKTIEKLSGNKFLLCNMIAIGILIGMYNGGLSIRVWKIKSICCLMLSGTMITIALMCIFRNMFINAEFSFCGLFDPIFVVGSHFFLIVPLRKFIPASIAANPLVACGCTFVIVTGYCVLHKFASIMSQMNLQERNSIKHE